MFGSCADDDADDGDADGGDDYRDGHDDDGDVAAPFHGGSEVVLYDYSGGDNGGLTHIRWMFAEVDSTALASAIKSKAVSAAILDYAFARDAYVGEFFCGGGWKF